MNVHFLTRDVMADYPRVNWIPSLPGDEQELLEKLSSPALRCHNIENPELIVRQDGESWSILVSAIDSGRFDCSGTPILIALYITGKNGVDMPPKQFVQHYINEYFEGPGKSSVLSEYFSDKIADGDPEKWSKLPQEEKTAIAGTLLKYMDNTEDMERLSFPAKPFWCGYHKKEDFLYFREFCSLLLDGGANGNAFSFTTLEKGKIEDILRVFGTAEHTAVLLDEKNNSTENLFPSAESDEKWNDGWSTLPMDSPAVPDWKMKSLPQISKVKKNQKKIIFTVILIGILTLLYIAVRIWSL